MTDDSGIGFKIEAKGMEQAYAACRQKSDGKTFKIREAWRDGLAFFHPNSTFRIQSYYQNVSESNSLH